MRRAVFAAVLVTTFLAGCAQEPLPGAPTAAASEAEAEFCAVGRVMVGIDANGAPFCREPPHYGFRCAEGEAIVGFDYEGAPQCGPFVVATPPPPAPPQEVSSNLKVTNVFGHRNDTSTSEIHKLKILAELSAGAVPMDLTKLIIRFSDGSTSYNYDYGYRGGKGFNTTWIRGTNHSAVMQAGDLVEIELHTWPAVPDIATRTSVSLSLIPETGSAVVADFKTPATYGTDKVITLR